MDDEPVLPTKPFLTKVEVRFEPANMTGSIYAIKASERGELVTLCDECGADNPTKVDQVYTCPNGHGPDGRQKLRGIEVSKGTYKAVATDDQMTAVKTGNLTPRVLTLKVRYADEVDSITVPTGNAWVFMPDRKNDNLYAVMRCCTVNGARIPGPEGRDLCLVGEVLLKGSEYLVRIESFGDNLLLRGLARPEDVRAFPVMPVVIPEGFQEQMLNILKADVQPLVDMEFHDKRRAEVAEFIRQRVEEGFTAEAPEVAIFEAPVQAEDLMAKLLQARKIEVTPATKPARKRASRKKAS